MIQIVLTPEQSRLVDQATGAISVVDANGRIVATMSPCSSHKVYASIPELVEDLGEWDEEESRKRLAGFQPGGSLND